jgi:hypothetical protein
MGFTSSQTAMNYAGYTTSAPTSLTNGSASTYALQTNGVWGTIANSNAGWVGISASASPSSAGTSPALGFYQFSTTFNAAGGAYTGDLSIMADDTAEIFLNGVLIRGFTSLGSDSYCSDTGINCRTATDIPLSAITLSGTNTLTFVVEQAGIVANGDPSGITFQAAIRSIAPEPNSLVLFGTGLLGATGLYLRRRAFTV